MLSKWREITIVKIYHNPWSRQGSRNSTTLHQAQYRETGQKLDLTDKGIIISEKLADLAGVSVGDELTVQNSQAQGYQTQSCWYF